MAGRTPATFRVTGRQDAVTCQHNAWHKPWPSSALQTKGFHMNQETSQPRLDAIVTLRFSEVPFPEKAATLLTNAGGKPLCAMHGNAGGRCVTLLMSDDLVGGKVERHLSVRASVDGVEVKPTIGEVLEAMQSTGMSEHSEILAADYSPVVHLFAARPSK